jgi:hypothetical protein
MGERDEAQMGRHAGCLIHPESAKRLHVLFCKIPHVTQYKKGPWTLIPS